MVELTLTRIFEAALLRRVLIMMAHLMILVCRRRTVAIWLLQERW